MVNAYELLYIVPAQYTEPEVEGVKEKVNALLAKAQAKVLRHETLAKIRLAYPIKKVRHGTYVLAHFDAEGTTITDLERSMRLADGVLRHHIIARAPGAEKRKFEINAYVPPLSEEGRPEGRTEGRREGARPGREEGMTRPAPRPMAPVAAAAPAKAGEASMSIEELDKRLDAILDEDVSKSA